MKQRRTATFNTDILVIGDALVESNRMIFYDSLINYFLAGRPLPLSEATPGELRVAFACAVPIMRAMQSKYDNGTIEKKFNGNAQGLLCLSERSETKRKEAERSETYNNIYPFPNLIYIFNKYITTNQSSACASTRARDEANKKPGGEEIAEVLSKLKSEEEQLYQYFYQIIQTIENSGALKIYGENIPAKKIIQSIYRLALKPGFREVLAGALKESSQPKVRDSIKYSISLLYNLGNIPDEKAGNKRKNFSERSYTDEELEGLFDNLEDIEVRGGI